MIQYTIVKHFQKSEVIYRLYTIVETNFGPDARNWVNDCKDKQKLVDFAEGMGWKKAENE